MSDATREPRSKPVGSAGLPYFSVESVRWRLGEDAVLKAEDAVETVRNIITERTMLVNRVLATVGAGELGGAVVPESLTTVGSSRPSTVEGARSEIGLRTVAVASDPRCSLIERAVGLKGCCGDIGDFVSPSSEDSMSEPLCRLSFVDIHCTHMVK